VSSRNTRIRKKLWYHANQKDFGRFNIDIKISWWQEDGATPQHIISNQSLSYQRFLGNSKKGDQQ